MKKYLWCFVIPLSIVICNDYTYTLNNNLTYNILAAYFLSYFYIFVLKFTKNKLFSVKNINKEHFSVLTTNISIDNYVFIILLRYFTHLAIILYFINLYNSCFNSNDCLMWYVLTSLARNVIPKRIALIIQNTRLLIESLYAISWSRPHIFIFVIRFHANLQNTIFLSIDNCHNLFIIIQYSRMLYIILYVISFYNLNPVNVLAPIYYSYICLVLIYIPYKHFKQIIKLKYNSNGS